MKLQKVQQQEANFKLISKEIKGCLTENIGLTEDEILCANAQMLNLIDQDLAQNYLSTHQEELGLFFQLIKQLEIKIELSTLTESSNKKDSSGACKLLRMMASLLEKLNPLMEKTTDASVYKEFYLLRLRVELEKYRRTKNFTSPAPKIAENICHHAISYFTRNLNLLAQLKNYPDILAQVTNVALAQHFFNALAQAMTGYSGVDPDSLKFLSEGALANKKVKAYATLLYWEELTALYGEELTARRKPEKATELLKHFADRFNENEKKYDPLVQSLMSWATADDSKRIQILQMVIATL